MEKKQKRKVLYTIEGKKFYSLDGMPLSKLKNHAEWIHPDLWPECGLSELEKNLIKGIAKEKEFQRICEKAGKKPLTKREEKFYFNC